MIIDCSVKMRIQKNLIKYPITSHAAIEHVRLFSLLPIIQRLLSASSFLLYFVPFFSIAFDLRAVISARSFHRVRRYYVLRVFSEENFHDSGYKSKCQRNAMLQDEIICRKKEKKRRNIRERHRWKERWRGRCCR